MSKMFLTLKEAAEKLGRSVEDVQALVADGTLQEFKQGDDAMLKTEQVDLLASGAGIAAGDSSSGDQVSLEDSFTEVIELDDASASGSAIGLADSNEATGISAFDTALGGKPLGDDDANLDSFGSGSQLLDLTRESDDSMVGAELMTESFEDDDPVEIPASASGIFNRMEEEERGAGVAAAIGAAPMAMPMVIEEYDGAGSGLGLGAMIAASISMVVVGLIVIAILEGGGSPIAATISDNLVMGFAIPLVLLFILLGVGFVVGRATE